jgi:hypothetical protein
VTPRLELAEAASELAASLGLSFRVSRGLLGYYRMITITR